MCLPRKIGTSRVSQESIVTGPSTDVKIRLKVLDIFVVTRSDRLGVKRQNRKQWQQFLSNIQRLWYRIVQVMFSLLSSQCLWPLKNSSDDRPVAHVIILIWLWSYDVNSIARRRCCGRSHCRMQMQHNVLPVLVTNYFLAVYIYLITCTLSFLPRDAL